MSEPKLSAVLNNCPLHALTPEIKNEILNFARNTDYKNHHNKSYLRLKKDFATFYGFNPDTFSWENFSWLLQRYNSFDTQIILGPVLRLFMKESMSHDPMIDMLAELDGINKTTFIDNMTKVSPFNGRYNSLSPDELFAYVSKDLGLSLHYHHQDTHGTFEAEHPITTVNIFHEGGIEGAQAGGHWERAPNKVDRIDYETDDETQLRYFLDFLGQDAAVNPYGFDLLKQHVSLTFKASAKGVELESKVNYLVDTTFQIVDYLFNINNVPKKLAMELLGSGLTQDTIQFIENYHIAIEVPPNEIYERYINAAEDKKPKLNTDEEQIISRLLRNKTPGNPRADNYPIPSSNPIATIRANDLVRENLGSVTSAPIVNNSSDGQKQADILVSLVQSTTNQQPEGVFPAIDNDLYQKLQKAVSDAEEKYRQYHNNKKNPNSNLTSWNRGKGDGWLSFFRHGATGLKNALNLKETIDGLEGNSDSKSHTAIQLILENLNSSSLHRHSFGSYLMDELNTEIFAKENAAIIPDTEQRYTPQQCVEAMQIIMLLESDNKALNAKSLDTKRLPFETPNSQNEDEVRSGLNPQENSGIEEQQRLEKKLHEETQKKESELLEQQKQLQEKLDKEELAKQIPQEVQATEKPLSDLENAPVLTQEKNNQLLVNSALHILIDTNQTERALVYIPYMDEKDLNVQSNGNTPLMLAMKKGNLKVTRALLENATINVTAEDNSGLTALHWAAILRADDIIVTLLKKGAKLYDEEDSTDDYYQEHPSALLKKTKSPRLLYQLNPMKFYFEQYLADSYNYFEIQDAYKKNSESPKKSWDVIKVEQDFEKFYGCKEPKFFTEEHKGIISAIAYSDLAFNIKDICFNMGWMSGGKSDGMSAPRLEENSSGTLRKLFSVYYTVFLENRNKLYINTEIQKALSGKPFEFYEKDPERKNVFKFFPRTRFNEKLAKEVVEKLEFIRQTSIIYTNEYQRVQPNKRDELNKVKVEALKRGVDSFFPLFFDYCTENNIETMVIFRGSEGHEEQQYPKFVDDIKGKFVVLNIDPYFVKKGVRSEDRKNVFYLGALADIELNDSIKTIFCDYTNPYKYNEAVPFAANENFLYLQGFWHGKYPVIELRPQFYKLSDEIRRTIMSVAFNHDLYIQTEKYDINFLKQQLEDKLEPIICQNLSDYISVAANIQDVSYDKLSISVGDDKLILH